MNPLTLLLGLLGAGIFSMARNSSGETTSINVTDASDPDDDAPRITILEDVFSPQTSDSGTDDADDAADEPQTAPDTFGGTFSPQTNVSDDDDDDDDADEDVVEEPQTAPETVVGVFTPQTNDDDTDDDAADDDVVEEPQTVPDTVLEVSTPQTNDDDTDDNAADDDAVEEPQTVPETVQDVPTPQTNDSDDDADEPQTVIEAVQDVPTPQTNDSGDDAPQPTAPDQSGNAGDDGGNIAAFATTGTVSMISGRVATLDPSASDIQSLRIVDGLDDGNVTVNPDGTLAVVMTQSDFVGNQSFSYEATHSNGSTSVHQVQLNVTEPVQAGGWGTGESHYMLETDENDRVVVEAGDDHQKVYISGSNKAYSLNDIASQEGISANQIDGAWLANSKYGNSEEFALDDNAGMMLWNEITPEGSHTSNWLLLDRGHEYDLGRILDRDTHGEDELHPLYVGSYGQGEKPDVTSYFQQFQESSSNVVFQDVAFSGGVTFLGGKNILFDGVDANEKISVQQAEGVTIRNSEFTDIVRSESLNGGDWEQHLDRISGLYSDRTDGLLLEGNLFDRIGWDYDYDENLSGSGGQPPSQYSQNIYINARMTDVTMRDTITMRAASFGAQIRSGGFVEDNVFLDNNAGFANLGGDYNGAGPVGNYTLLSDNLVTSGAHKEAPQIGAKTLGIDDDGLLTSFVDNIVAHLADPNSNELDWKWSTHDGLGTNNPFYDDSIVYNWETNVVPGKVNEYTLEQNSEGLDTAALNQTTIQLYAQQLLNDSNATIADLAEYMRDHPEVDADAIIRFFQEGFGIAPDERSGGETLRFVPDDLGDGVRWDNRLNWDTDDLPGLFASDSVDLGGNDVVFGTNATIDKLDLGPDGSLNVYGGRLNVDGGLNGDSGSLNIEGAGQLWADGSTADDLEIAIESGRFVNTGDFSDADLTATGGQTILASDDGRFEVSNSKTLAIFDSLAKVGFDGENSDLAILDFEDGSTVAFKATDNDLGTIEEFDSGRFNNSDVKSGIDLGNSSLSIDLAGLSAQDGASFTLMDADEITGIFDEAIVGGLGSKGAKIVVDYQADTVTLVLNNGGNGQVDIETVGEQSDVDDGSALWNALTLNQGVVAENTLSYSEDDDDPLESAA